MKVIINEQEFEVSERLVNYSIFKHQSSNIYAVGVDQKFNEIFVQFHAGKCYVYRELPEDGSLSVMAANPGSFKMATGDPMTIGKFVANHLVGKYPSTMISETPLVTPLFVTEVVMKDHKFNRSKELVAVKSEILNVVTDKGETLIVQSKNGGKTFSVKLEEVLKKVSK